MRKNPFEIASKMIKHKLLLPAQFYTTSWNNQTTTRKVTTNYFLQDAARELSPLFCSAGALVRRSLYYHGWEEPQCSQICRLAIPMATLFLKTIHKYHFLGSACALFLNKSCVTHLCASTNTHTDPHTHQCLTDMATWTQSPSSNAWAAATPANK